MAVISVFIAFVLIEFELAIVDIGIVVTFAVDKFSVLLEFVVERNQGGILWKPVSRMCLMICTLTHRAVNQPAT